MRPTLPRRLFDLCVVPEHDGVAPSSNTLVTRGALNRVRPAAERRPGQTMVLVGGPSRDHGWSEESLLAQVTALLEEDAGQHWLLCDSRRTPAHTRTRLHELAGERVEFVAHDAVSRDWLPATLAAMGTVWVSEDSVSMVYEALSGGAAVGVLDVPRLHAGRVARGVDTLCERGLVRRFDDWQTGRAPVAPSRPLAEADRVAAWICEHWLGDAC